MNRQIREKGINKKLEGLWVVVKFEKYFTTKGTKIFHKAHKKPL
jgi:hypothetical protein